MPMADGMKALARLPRRSSTRWVSGAPQVRPGPKGYDHQAAQRIARIASFLAGPGDRGLPTSLFAGYSTRPISLSTAVIVTSSSSK